QQPITVCRKDSPAVSPIDSARYLQALPQWSVREGYATPRLERRFTFKNFAQALEFTNRIGALADAEDHHPALLTEWGKVQVQWWTHSIGGLHLNDFAMAARCDVLYKGLQSQG